jgi:phosphatidylglycerophosphatase A
MRVKNEHLRTWYGAIATVMWVGTFSAMPGTLGTAVALVFFLLTSYNSVLLILLVTIVGTIAADRYATSVSRDDPGEVVIDEVAGYLVSVWGLGRSFALVGFILFRIIDIVKPFPVRQMERLPGGIGIMADDLLGGVIVNLLLRALQWFFFADGLRITLKFLGMGE